MRATSAVSGNKDLKKAMADKKKVASHLADLEKARDSGAIKGWQFDRAVNKLGAYQGVENGDDVSRHLVNPQVKVNLEEEIRKNMKDVRKQYHRDTYIDVDGVRKIRDVSYYDPEELKHAYEVTISLPRNQAYIAEMIDHFGEEETNKMLNNYEVSAINALETEQPKFTDMAEGSPYGAGARDAGVQQGYDVTDIGEVIEVGDKLDYGTGILGHKYSVEKRREYRDTIDEQFPGMLSVIGSAVKSFYGANKTDEEFEQEKKFIKAAATTAGLSEEQMSQLTVGEQEEIKNNYLELNEKRMRHIGVLDFNPLKAKEAGLVPKASSATDATIRKAIHDNIVSTGGAGKGIVSMDDFSKQTLKDNPDLAEVLNSGKFIVQGQINPATFSFEENPHMASSVLIRVNDDDSSINGEKFAVSMPQDYIDKYGSYEKFLSELSGTFSLLNVDEEFPIGKNGSISGKRNADNSIGISKIVKRDGTEVPQEVLIQVADKSSNDNIRYENGYLTGLNPYEIAGFVNKL
jgi:hypothetical protein